MEHHSQQLHTTRNIATMKGQQEDERVADDEVDTNIVVPTVNTMIDDRTETETEDDMETEDRNGGDLGELRKQESVSNDTDGVDSNDKRFNDLIACSITDGMTPTGTKRRQHATKKENVEDENPKEAMPFSESSSPKYEIGFKIIKVRNCCFFVLQI